MTANIDQPAKHKHQVGRLESIATVVAGLAALGVILYLLIRNEPFADPNFVTIARTIVALLAAICAGAIPGFFHLGFNAKGLRVRAGSALITCLLAYVYTPSVQKANAIDAKVARDAIEFQQIEIDEDKCQWKAIERPFQVYAPATNFEGKPWGAARPVVGKPVEKWAMGTEQIAGFLSKETEKSHDRTIDPVFSVVLTNISDEPVTLNAIGILPVAAWDAMKGAPCVVKLRDFEAVAIKMNGFDPSKPQMHKLDAPVYIGPKGAFRTVIRLVGYNKAVPGNESGIRLVAEANQRKFYSQDIYLGLALILGD